jgi:phosphatidyl-myo-inositol dimannoside synthase
MIKKKFILFTLEYSPFKGGIAQYYQNLAQYWPAGELTVLTDGEPLSTDPANIIRRSLLNKYLRPRWLNSIFQLSIINYQLKKERGLIHIMVGQILPLGIPTYFLAKIFKFKYSVILHGLDFSLAIATKRKKKITGKILAKAEKIICANNYTANLVKFFNADLSAKISVVNPGIEPSFVRNPERVRKLKNQYNLNDKIVLFSLGRLVERKGFDKVIAAMPAAISAAPNLIYAIAGTGPEENNLKNLVATLPEEIKNKIIFLGSISDTDRWAWLELCDIFIMPARNIDGDFEGFGTVYLEVNLAGKPVIAGDSGGVRDAVINNINGLLINPEKPEEIAQAIIKLSADSELRQALGSQGKRRAVENFNAKKQVEKIYSFLSS